MAFDPERDFHPGMMVTYRKFALDPESYVDMAVETRQQICITKRGRLILLLDPIDQLVALELAFGDTEIDQQP